MTFLLRTSDNIPDATEWSRWLAVTGSNLHRANLDPLKRLPDLPKRLEISFTDCRDSWLAVGRELYAQPNGNLSHAAACASFGSDFGLMLAWVGLAQSLIKDDEATLMICDDPWVFRAIAEIQGVDAKSPPGLAGKTFKLWLRGLVARFATAGRLVISALKTRNLLKNIAKNAPSIVVYGHPTSDADGHDAYFGDLMRHIPNLQRLLHTDCRVAQAQTLGRDQRTASLHAYGSMLYAMSRVPFAVWRPKYQNLDVGVQWLVERASAFENSGGGPAMNAWQQHCQVRWLEQTQPRSVCWPWENFAWERTLAKASAERGIETFGYQHTVVGPHQFNYSVKANSDGLESIPTRIFANGPAYADDLKRLGMPADRIDIMGSFRLRPGSGVCFKKNGPVFVPLSGNLDVAESQIIAAQRVAEAGLDVLVKAHPMYPISIPLSENVTPTDIPFNRQPQLSAVLFATGASGLEALLAGIPCIRLHLPDRISIDILPSGVTCPTTNLETVVKAITQTLPIEPLAYDQVFSAPDYAHWKRLLL